jgi:CBS domain-containing protein
MKNFLIDRNETIYSALEKISLNSHRTVLVTKEKKVIGVLSGGDIAKIVLKKIDLNAPLIKIVNKSFKFLKRDDAKLARKIFKKYSVGMVPVLNKKMELEKIYLIKDFL